MKPFVAPLAGARKDLEAATMWFMENALEIPDNAGAGSTPYMHLFGVTGIAFMWAMMAKVANDKLPAAKDGDKAYYETKIKTGRYYMEHVVPETATHLARIRHGAAPMMALAANEF
jgi:hypothetical protein